MNVNGLSSIIITILLFMTAIRGRAQQSAEFTPSGKPFALVYSDLNASFTKDDWSKSFELTRVYLGYEYAFSKTLSSRVNIDIGDPGAGKLQMTAFIKNAYLLYRNNGLSVRFGMIGTDQFNIQEKQWGYRYIDKSFQDAYNFGPSADLGAGLEYSPSDFFSFDISLLNGEGYKKLQADSAFKETIGITLKPIKGFILRGYADMMNHNSNQISLAIFAGYSAGSFRSGFEYNTQKNNLMKDGNDFSGISAFASIGFREKFSFFGRYDNLWSETPEGETNPWNYNKDGQLFMIGFDYSPVKGVKIAPVFTEWSPADRSLPFISTASLNFELKL
jgi:hypothetical protein